MHHSLLLLLILPDHATARGATPTPIPQSFHPDATKPPDANTELAWPSHIPAARPDGTCSYSPPGTPPAALLYGQPECPPPISGVSLAARQPLGPANWTPWTHAPYCCANSSYCVFTNAGFRAGRGFSIVTTPERLASAQTLLDRAFAAGPLRVGGSRQGVVKKEDEEESLVEEADTQRRGNCSRNSNSSNFTYPDDQSPTAPWEIKAIPGKGMGMVARRRIPRGETFLIDHAAVVASVDFPGRVRRAQGAELLGRAVGQLADPEKVLGLARTSTQGAPVVEDVMRTNTFSVSIDDEAYMALFPTVSRINHACGPNSQVKFDSETLSQKVSAFLDIGAGEEITISYSEFGMTYKNRQSTLLNRWGFKCTCTLCSASSSAVAASDARRTRAISVRDGVLEAIRAGRLREAISLGEQLVDISEREGLVSGLGDHYEILARLHMGAGDLVGAGKYARRALDEMGIFGGRKAYASFDELDLFVRSLERKRSSG